MSKSEVRVGEFASFLKDLEQSYHQCIERPSEAYTFDRILWLYAGRFGKDSEKLLRMYSECWIRYRIKSGLFDLSVFEDSLSCVDWLIAEQATLREAPVPGMEGFTAFVYQRGPSTLRARFNCPSRGVAFVEGIIQTIGKAYDDRIELKRTMLGVSFSELELSCWNAATYPKSS